MRIQTPSELEFKQLLSPDNPDFDSFFAIYQEAIPASERKPRQALEIMVERENYRTLVAKLGRRVVGFSIIFIPQTRSFALLEYMAVKKARRRRGFGTAIFRESIRLVLEELGPVPLLLEVDSDREQARDYEQRVQRLRFYRRHGCRRIAGLYYILPLNEELSPPAMDLLIYQQQAAHVSKGDLALWMRSIYSEVYGRLPNDPRINNMLEGIPDTIVLE